MSAAADKLRAWAKGLDDAKKAPQANALRALADVVEKEVATAGQSVAADASEGAERACLEPIAAELSELKTGGHAEAPVTIEPETFAVLAALREFRAQFDFAVKGVKDAVAETHEAKALVESVKAQLATARAAAETLHRALHGTLSTETESAAS